MKLLKGIELNGTYKVAFSDTCVEVYDENDNLIYFENSGGYWYKCEYDARGNEVYCEYNYGYWAKWEYDENDNQTYFEDSVGVFIDKRIKELTVK
jgi:hypothetical protein